MSVANPTFSQIRAQVAAIRRSKKPNQARTIGIHSTGRWTGESLNHHGGETYLIRQCDSPLALRLALRTPADTNTITVLLTPLEDSELSDDIRVRLAKQRLVQIEAWQIVRTLFQAQAVDPRLARHRWMADLLLESIPSEGYPAARGAFLDAETVWPLLLRQKLALVADIPDLTALLRWSLTPAAVGQWKHLSEEFRKAATEWLIDSAGPVVGVLLPSMAGWDHPDAVPIGLAAVVLFHPSSTGLLDKAIGKLEGLYLGNRSLPADLMRSWGAAATEVVRAIRHTDADRARQLLARADELLQELGAIDSARLSKTSPAGYDQRLAAYGQHLAEVLRKGSPGSLEKLTAARDEIRDHDYAARESRRLGRVEMALRLVRWLSAQRTAGPGPRSLREAAEDHLTEGGFVDWARLTLVTGDSSAPLSTAYARLFAAVTEVRERQAKQFAGLLVDWTATGSQGDEVLPVERILNEVVAPLAAERPVLVLVVDGMSMAVGRELVTDLLQNGWLPLAEPGRSHNRAGLAALPSITEFSRTSLLCGNLQKGTAEIEKPGFAELPSLVRHCRAGNPPILFHKASLKQADDAGLAKEVRDAIQSSHRRVVGVVVNAIDDYLAKGDQLDINWTQDRLHILPALLDEARTSGRLVVLLSDHGHILDFQTVQRTPDGVSEARGARWKSTVERPQADEFAISGSRVLVDGQRLTAPWSERVRYGGKQHGYHGGLSPQEMVVPVIVLSSSDKLPGAWQLQPVDLPCWWDESLAETPTPTQKTPPLKPQKQSATGTLFDMEAEARPVPAGPVMPNSPDWISRLVKSPVYEQQQALATRGLRDPVLVERILQALDGRGGRMTSLALARALSLPELRVSGLLAQMSRLLNVDGYQVLSYDPASFTIELNHDLLLKQFDLV
ncbi:BREX-2 system phosphatase PglZ [Planctomyces sp. SH-PL14]|uniref:BREX-2 system phosphatase PglZ n=1 Tax=Planctomyces sp. SH-PL14 TaxID=1632864 RepID=UPI00078C5A90|nr:BREX-2 system phosphatase PglZ [Planctomyces sp. SH-PL14]AMV19859.1 PglZ domain protein [Planctomyces sp. SH-PL14]